MLTRFSQQRSRLWWNDGTPDLSGTHPEQTAYAAWWAGLTETERESGS